MKAIGKPWTNAIVLAMAATTVAAIFFGVPLEAQVAMDEAAWDVQARESRFEAHLDRDALFMQGGVAWLKDAEFGDGVIEFDLAATADNGFHGLRFRAVDPANHEHIYLRPHLSGLPDAVQYQPIFNRTSSWQLYADARYVQPAEIRSDEWVHVRLAVRESRAEVTIDGVPIVFPQLVRDPASGAVGLATSGAGAWFANVIVRPGVDPAFAGGEGAEAPDAVPGVVTRWRVSDAFPEETVDGLERLAADFAEARTWTTLEPEVRGIANIGMLYNNRPDNTVIAALTLRSDRARTLPVKIGFSDRVRVYLNGRALFAASDAFASRDYRFLGTIGLYDELFLPLEAGDNELWLAVTEQFGGWGVTLQALEAAGVTITGPEGAAFAPR
ncbi:MAG: family 16 glycoside hydrolase [Gemmatimonadota bacterium]